MGIEWIKLCHTKTGFDVFVFGVPNHNKQAFIWHEDISISFFLECYDRLLMTYHNQISKPPPPPGKMRFVHLEMIVLGSVFVLPGSCEGGYFYI